jgi:hypothetical protein
MTNVVPVFPNGIFSWIDRVDQQSVDFAGDINSVASDLISVESTLGTNPQKEPSPPSGGTPLTYATVSARISDAMQGAQLPVCVLSGIPAIVNNTSAGLLNNYTVAYDPFSYFNGTDITIKNAGWYIVNAHQYWTWWNDGFAHQFLTVNGSSNILDEDLVDWEFSGNGADESDESTPRWQVVGLRSRITRNFWQGRLNKGDRLSILSENGSSNTNMKISSMVFTAAMLRTLPPTGFVSGH